MQVHYDAESDILMIILRDQTPSNAIDSALLAKADRSELVPQDL
jgi:uncharacterized protein YuzE